MTHGPGAGEGSANARPMDRPRQEGVEPSEPPVEQPTNFEFVINRRTAKARFRSRCSRGRTKWLLAGARHDAWDAFEHVESARAWGAT
jgi:hypothetical protein